MSKLTDEQMRDVLKITNHMVRNSMYGAFWPELEQACRAIEAAATEPMLQRIAELERQLEESRNQALEEAAKAADDLKAPDDYSISEKSMWDIATMSAADAIRALKGAKE